jgi:hypothetical protein
LTVEDLDTTTRVVLAGEAGPVEVRLNKEMSQPLLSQCQAKVPGAVRVFTLASIAPA